MHSIALSSRVISPQYPLESEWETWHRLSESYNLHLAIDPRFTHIEQKTLMTFASKSMAVVAEISHPHRMNPKFHGASPVSDDHEERLTFTKQLIQTFELAHA